jgi:hypothetical protein
VVIGRVSVLIGSVSELIGCVPYRAGFAEKTTIPGFAVGLCRLNQVDP